jgi:hypothetical protein
MSDAQASHEVSATDCPCEEAGSEQQPREEKDDALWLHRENAMSITPGAARTIAMAAASVE